MQLGPSTSFSIFDPKQLIGKHTGNHAKIAINMGVVRFLDGLRRRSNTVAAMIGFAKTWIQPWHVEWKFRNDKESRTFANQNDDAHISMQFDGLPQAALSDFLAFGFCVVRYIKLSNVSPEEDSPSNYRPEVMEPDLYDVIMEHNRISGIRTYQAYHIAGAHPERTEVKHSRVFIFRHPNPITGQINSPLMSAYENIMALENSLALTMVCQDRMVYPLTYYEKTKEDMVLKDTQIESSHPGADVVSTADSANQFVMTRNEIAKLNMHQIADQLLDANIQRRQVSVEMQEQAAYRNPSLASTREVFLQYSREMPHLPTFKLPLNVTVGEGPKSQMPPDYLEFQHRLREEIAQAFGIPASVVFGGSNKFAADVAFTKLQLGQVVKDWEHSLSEVLIRTYMDIYYNQISAMLKNRIDDKVEKKLQKDKRSKSDPKKARRIKVFISEKLYRRICDELHFSIFFEKITLLEPEYVRMLFDTETIDYATFQKLMLSIGNIPQSNRNVKGKAPPTEREAAQEASRQEALKRKSTGVTSEAKKVKKTENDLNKEATL